MERSCYGVSDGLIHDLGTQSSAVLLRFAYPDRFTLQPAPCRKRSDRCIKQIIDGYTGGPACQVFCNSRQYLANALMRSSRPARLYYLCCIAREPEKCQKQTSG